jgi:predicted SAM-dependent methyltransferase
MSLKDRLPPDVRRRLGRIKRAVLDQPEPVAKRRPKPKPKAQPPLPVAVATSELSRLELRRKCIFEGRSTDSRVLEIGPAHNPILPRRDGYNTENVDYLDRAGLVDKYKAFDQYDPDDIEEVDWVLAPGAKMSDVIADRFDIVLASHVLEHTTSLIDFLNECGALLAPDGRVALVVPDQRFTFDRFRQRSSLGRIIDLHLEPRPVHSVGTMVDFTMNAVKHRGTTAWKPGHHGNYSMVNELDVVKQHRQRAAAQDSYIDMHNWIFTPHHLRLLLFDLEALGYIGLREETFHPTVGHEFFINLSPSGGGPGLTREELVDLADAELRTLDVPTWR